MRILIAAGFVGHHGETDGVVTTYRHLVPLLARSGHAVDVVAYGPQDGLETTGGVRLFVHRPRVPLKVDSVRRIDAAFGQTALARALAREPYDVVQSSTPDPMGLWARGVARELDVPFVALYHTALGDYVRIRARRAAGALAGKLLGAAMEHWLRRYFNGADLVLAPSRTVVEQISCWLRPPADVLGRGVDIQRFHPGKRRRAAGRVRALYVGRVAPEKNLDLLAQILAEREDIDLTVVGDGPALPALRARLPRACFPGRLAGEALAAEYADADFFVFPSRTDTLGNVVLEAMASGLPAVVTDSMGPKELVDPGVTGFVAHSDQEFAAHVGRLAGDAECRRKMGAAARQCAETRSWDGILGQLLAHYATALALRAPARRAAVAGLRPSAPPTGSRTVRVRGPRPLCVLDISEFFGETSGGVKTYLAQKARYVESRRDLRQVLVVPGAIDSVTARRGVRFYRVRGPAVPTQRPYRFLLDTRQIRRIVADERPDIIEIGSHFLAPWLVRGIAKSTNTPVVWFCHSNLPRIVDPYPENSSWMRRQVAAWSGRYLHRLSRQCRATLAPSDAMADELEGLGVTNVARVTLGVDVERFTPERSAQREATRRRLGLPLAPLVLYAGRITAEKGVDLLLDAWPAIERATDAHLVLVGDGPERAQLEARHATSRTHWFPYEADRDRLADLMAAADLYVAPSVVETFGLSALEAMSCDTPVLCPDRGAVAEHVRRSGAGALFGAGSAAQLAARAGELLTEPCSQLRRRGSAYVSGGFSWRQAFERIFGVYEEVLCGAVSA